MKILFTFENPLPSREADAEVFTATYLAALAERSWLHVPLSNTARSEPKNGLSTIRARAPGKPAVVRHFCCGLTIAGRREFRQADFVYTRNLWVATAALLFGQRVVFDHYRPWPDQIPPLQPLIGALMSHPRFLLNICHSDFTRGKYLELGLPPDKLVCIRNGFEPERLRSLLPIAIAKQLIGVPADRKTVVYTGRVNGKKGLDLLIGAAARLPDILFILVGSAGDGPVEALAEGLTNVRLVPWQQPDALSTYLGAADVLVIPPSTRPLAQFGSTVLPLKVFLYMASGRPILAGATADVMEVLRHRQTAFLCRPNCPKALAEGLTELLGDRALASRLAAAALTESRDLTWDARARRIFHAIKERQSAPAHWDRRHARLRPWLRRCAQWLVHLVRFRSIVLPPEGVPSSDALHAGPV